MTDKRIAQQHHATFEEVRQFDEDGNEFWSARNIAPLLEYQDWRNFMQVVDKARLACEQSGRPVADHFGDVTKMVGIGSGAQRPVPDVHLSRYACYLIVQNGDPARPVIANGQTYFEVGRKVRQTIDELGGTMPENLPKPESSIQQIESAKKKLAKKKAEK